MGDILILVIENCNDNHNDNAKQQYQTFYFSMTIYSFDNYDLAIHNVSNNDSDNRGMKCRSQTKFEYKMKNDRWKLFLNAYSWGFGVFCSIQSIYIERQVIGSDKYSVY